MRSNFIPQTGAKSHVYHGLHRPFGRVSDVDLPGLDRHPKFVPIDEQSDDDVMHLD
jgi:hypothetical protein